MRSILQILEPELVEFSHALQDGKERDFWPSKGQDEATTTDARDGRGSKMSGAFSAREVLTTIQFPHEISETALQPFSVKTSAQSLEISLTHSIDHCP